MYKKYSFLSLAFLIITLNSCLSTKKLAEIKQEEEERERELLQDSTSIYSLHPSKPFKYGYALSLEQCEDNRKDLEEYNIKNGEVVASIGAASGWIEGIYSTMVDSVTFYIQDVDTSFLNQEQLDKVVKYYSSVRNKPQTNRFEMTIGNRHNTNLPEDSFDKIIINNAFHHILRNSYMPLFLRDIRRKLLYNGQVIIGEKMSNEYKNIKHDGCNINGIKAKKIIKIFTKNGFHLTNMVQPENSFDNKLIFESNKNRGDNYFAKRLAIDEHIKLLDQMNLKRYNSDSLKAMKIAKLIKPKIVDIQNVYSSIDFYLYNLANELIEKEKYPEAINVMKANIYLFPESSQSYFLLAKSYLNIKDYESAKINYKIAHRLNPKNTVIKSIIKDIEEEEKLNK